MAPGSEGGALDPDLAARIATLRWRASRIVDGLMSGAHRSPHRGASVVFVEHRDYRPGDDVRLLDFRAFARTDRPVIKRFEQETQLRAYLALDQSESMNFRSRDGLDTKRTYAATLLAGIAYVLTSQGDAVGVVTFDAALDAFLPARSHPSHLEAALGILANAGGGTRTHLQSSLASIAERIGRRGVVVIASDLLDLTPDALSPIAHLASRGHDVLVFHVLDPRELELDAAGAALVRGLEGESPLEVDLEAVRAAYQREITAFIERSRTECLAAGARYVQATTTEPPEQVLSRALMRGSRS